MRGKRWGGVRMGDEVKNDEEMRMVRERKKALMKMRREGM